MQSFKYFAVSIGMAGIYHFDGLDSALYYYYIPFCLKYRSYRPILTEFWDINKKLYPRRNLFSPCITLCHSHDLSGVTLFQIDSEMQWTLSLSLSSWELMKMSLSLIRNGRKCISHKPNCRGNVQLSFRYFSRNEKLRIVGCAEMETLWRKSTL